MRLTLIAAAIAAVSLVSGCAVTGETGQMARAVQAGCDPRSTVLQPHTPRFKACKIGFPELLPHYEAKEMRYRNPQLCDPFLGDQCSPVYSTGLPDLPRGPITRERLR